MATVGTAYAVTRPEPTDLWHRRMAHCHKGILQATARIKEPGVQLKGELSPRRTCNLQKSTQRNYPTATEHTAVQPCQRVYTDIMGPISPMAKGGFAYVSKFTDEFTRVNVVYLIKTKDEAVHTLGRFVQDVVVPHGFRLERLRSENGGEYTASYFIKYCKDIGVVQELTTPYAVDRLILGLD